MKTFTEKSQEKGAKVTWGWERGGRIHANGSTLVPTQEFGVRQGMKATCENLKSRKTKKSREKKTFWPKILRERRRGQLKQARDGGHRNSLGGFRNLAVEGGGGGDVSKAEERRLRSVWAGRPDIHGWHSEPGKK